MGSARYATVVGDGEAEEGWDGRHGYSEGINKARVEEVVWEEVER